MHHATNNKKTIISDLLSISSSSHLLKKMNNNNGITSVALLQYVQKFPIFWQTFTLLARSIYLHCLVISEAKEVAIFSCKIGIIVHL